MTYEWAKPGVKVVCVETWVNNLADTEYELANDVGPIEGELYTIRTIGPIHPKYPTDICVTLSEIRNKTIRFQGELYETCFGLYRFRPLITKKLPDTLTILLEKPNRLIVPDGFDNLRIKTKEKVTR